MHNDLPEKAYIKALTEDLLSNIIYLQQRPIISIFFGGGTPSLFTAPGIAEILNIISRYARLSSEVEITLEANPGTLTTDKLKGYISAGINRLSIGLQSLNDKQLKKLGRIHNKDVSIKTVKNAQDHGFSNINVDLMYGLPQQTTAEALNDLNQALELQTPHFSWYQLTIEPNTEFYHTKPPIPLEDTIWEMQQQGQLRLHDAGLIKYEVSAYSKDNQQCRHNLNYWQFGDYLGIGAGAHSKITNCATMKIHRHWQLKHPKQYLQNSRINAPNIRYLSSADMIFEFMLNNLRLTEGVNLTTFRQRTNLCPSLIAPILEKAQNLGLIHLIDMQIILTDLGTRFLNDLITLFLMEDPHHQLAQ